MWLSRKTVVRRDSGADVGEVSIGGGSAAVLRDGEHRGLAVFAPGGYVWRPRTGSDVLVIKCGDSGMCVAGERLPQAPDDLLEGEVYIKSDGGASLRLKNDGSIELTGQIMIDGGLYLNGNEIG